MRQTIDRQRVGTTEYRAYAYYQIPLADPEALGNGGLEGFDEDSEQQADFPTVAKAEAWLRRTVKANPDRIWGNAVVEQHDWQADEWDWEGETVLDAEARHVHTWTYWVGNTGKVELQDHWDEREW